LRRFLDDELDALAAPMRKLEARVRDFWRHPGTPALSVWANNFPAPELPPTPSDGSLSERALCGQLRNSVASALESRRYGFGTVPVLSTHDRHYDGPAFGARFLSAIMGAQVLFPGSLPAEERTGLRAGVKPLIESAAEIDRLHDVDVSGSPALRAILRAFEELAEIVQGRIPFIRYAPTLPLDFAADLIGHERFFELAAADPDEFARLIDVCTDKWLEIICLQERAVGGELAGYHYQPGCYINDMILRYLSPETIRRVVIPYNARLSAAFNGVTLCIDHSDHSLLEDYARLPDLHGCGFKHDWPASRVLKLLRDNTLLTPSLAWHYHRGKRGHPAVYLPWEEHCRRLLPFAGRMRILATLSGRGDTRAERRACLLRDLEDLRGIWEKVGSKPKPVETNPS